MKLDVVAKIESDKNFSQFGKVGCDEKWAQAEKCQNSKIGQNNIENLVPSKREMDVGCKDRARFENPIQAFAVWPNKQSWYDM